MLELILIVVIIAFAILGHHLNTTVRTPVYMYEKLKKQGRVYDEAGVSMTCGTLMWYPVIYFLVAEKWGVNAQNALRLDLGIADLQNGAFELSTGRIVSWAIFAVLVILALISFIRGLMDFLPHLRDFEYWPASGLLIISGVALYTWLLFSEKGFLHGIIRILFPKVVVIAAFIILLILFYDQMKDREKFTHGMTLDEYERERDEQDKRIAEKLRKEREESMANAGVLENDEDGNSQNNPNWDFDLNTPSPRDSGKATMQDMPSVIRDSAGRTYHRTSYGGSPATYTCDDDYSTIAIYNVYQSESYWMNTNAGSFEIVSW